ncbi:MAG: class I SAM-dependent methyltransferase [Alphaproteobacteria bacterium]
MLPCYARRLPSPLAVPLFGDRQRWGRTPPAADPDWRAWEACMTEVYEKSQRQGLGRIVNDAGYRILQSLDLDGRSVLEIGPGALAHTAFWRGRPARYVLVDRRACFLEQASARLAALGVPVDRILSDGASPVLPLPDASVDVVLAFYCLEHLWPLTGHLAELKRILRPGGLLAGAIPSEGGLAWGLGRLLTTARTARRDYGIDLGKVICWEHPNFADQIIEALDAGFHLRQLSLWPLRLPSPDVNLVIKFIAERPAEA